MKGRKGVINVPRQHDGHFGFGLGLKRASRIEAATVRDLHVSEQNTEIRLIHAELCLHGLCGQTDLAAYNAPSTLEPYTRVDSLDSVGAIHIIGGKHITQRR